MIFCTSLNQNGYIDRSSTFPMCGLEKGKNKNWSDYFLEVYGYKNVKNNTSAHVRE